MSAQHLVGEQWINSQEKRRTDLLISRSLAPAIGAVSLGLMAALKIENKELPTTRTQTRVGQNGCLFEILKLRSVNPSVELTINSKTNKPHSTNVGRFIQAMSLDELPQVVNVMRGEMSMIGPRPIMKKDVEQLRDTLSQSEFKNWYRAYTAGKPGIAGIYSVMAHSPHTTVDGIYDRAASDVYYYEHASSSMDLTIIKKTIGLARDLAHDYVTPIQTDNHEPLPVIKSVEAGAI